MRVPDRPHRALGAGAALLALSVFATACSTDSTSENSAAGVLNIGMPAGPLTENHNPYLRTSAGNAVGYRSMINEPLALSNPVRPDEEMRPWLAEEWEWSTDFTSLEITVREGPEWNDGTEFTAADVAFTFELLRDHPALNRDGIPFDEVSHEGRVVGLTFGEPQFVNQVRILETLVVPEHIWAEQDDPETWENPDPVGTGPYELATFTPQTVTLTVRDDYWQDLPEVEELRYTSYNDNNAQTTALANGETEWSFVFMPDYETVYIDRDPDHHRLWFPTGLGIHGLWLNNERAPFDDPAVRRALARVIDRHDIHEQAHAGLYPALENPTGLPMPAGEAFVAPEFSDVVYESDVEAAVSELAESGYELVDGRLLDGDGEQFTVELTGPAGWSDYLTALAIIEENLAEIGISASVETRTADAWRESVDSGEFDATLHWTNNGATPYDMYQHIMDGSLYAPEGEASPGGNFGRFRSDAADAALETFSTSENEEERTEALHELQRILVEEVPMVPTVAGPMGAQYNTRNWVGWPDESDPYAASQPTELNSLDIVLRLTPADG